MQPEILLIGPMMPHVMEALESAYRVHRYWEVSKRDALLAEAGTRIRAIGTNGHLGASAALMDALPKLEIIACYGVGVDAIDLEQAARRGVIVTNTPDVLNEDVSNMAIALMLATTRRLCEGDRFVREGRWLAGDMALTRTIQGLRLGILGLGRIGKLIAKKAKIFGCDVAYHGRREQAGVAYRYYSRLTEMARASDILVVICPGGEETQNLVDREVIDALGPEGILINVARGSVVEEAALVEALVEGRLGGAGLDVFADEPHVPEALLSLECVVLSPHQGSGTLETRRAMGDLVVENLRAHFAGKPVVTPIR